MQTSHFPMEHERFGLRSQDAASWKPFLSTTDFSLNCNEWRWGRHSVLLLSYHMLQPAALLSQLRDGKPRLRGWKDTCHSVVMR